MSKAEATPATTRPPKKGGKKKLLLIGTSLLLLGGGGAGAALYASGMLTPKGGPAQPDRPQLVPREGTSEYDSARYFSPTGDKKVDPTKFQATYIPLDEKFTANLKDGDGFVQIEVGVATYYDERVAQAVEKHGIPIRSAIIEALTSHGSMAIAAPDGKTKLRAELRKAVNDVLKQKEGFGGIDDVYFTSFIMQ
jgi:flagellar protein FliL